VTRIKIDTLRQRLLPSQAQRNFRLGVANGVLFSLAEALADANIVLALLVRDLGGSQALVGLLPSLKNGGWLLPQLLVAGRIEGMPRKLPLYRRSACARAIAFLVMTLVVFNAGALGPALTLLLMFTTYTVYNLTGGSSSLAFQDIVAKTIPPRRRGSFFSYRQLFGGLLAFFVGGPLVRALLQQDGPLAFPINYGVLCLIAFVILSLALLSFGLVEEPALERPARRHSLRETLDAAPKLFRDDIDFRRFIIARLVGRLGAIADPFYIIYAREALNIAPRYVGIYLALRVLTAALSNLYWGRVADVQGNRRLMVLTGWLAVLTPLAALVLPSLFAPGSTALAWAFGLVFLLIGVSMDGSAMAGTTYLLELAPQHELPTYCGIANTSLGVVTFLPVLGGLLLTAFNNNYTLLFWIGLIGALAALAATLRLREVREVREDMRQAALMAGSTSTPNR
jgi:MFS family permease